MGIRYKLVQRKDFSKGAGPDAKLYYPQLLNNGNISFDELCDSIAQETALSSADVKGVMDRLARLTSLNLKQGRSINLGELGSLRVVLSSAGSITEDGYKAATMMRPLKIVFTPGKALNDIRDKATYDRITVKPEEDEEGTEETT